MSNSMVAKRYALALFQIAKEQQLLGVIEEELRVVKEVFVYNHDLKAVLKSPKLTIEKKKEILKAAFTSVNPYVLNTLLILIDRHREDEIIEVANQFFELANEESGVAEAKVYSTFVSLQKQNAMPSLQHLQRRSAKNHLRIENIVDSELLGGVKLRIGNRIYDGSFARKARPFRT